MEVSQEEQKEVLDILSKHSGLELDEIHDECTYIDSQTHLAKILHQMNNLGLVYKINKKYHRTALDNHTGNAAKHKPVEQVTKPLTQQSDIRINPVVDQRFKIHKKTEEPILPPDLLEGELRRTKAGGGLALAAYLLRNRDFVTIEDFFELVEMSSGVFYTSISKLVKANYLIKDKVSNKIIYKWSGKFRYPFPSYKETDKDLLKISIKEWEDKKYPKENTEAKKEIPESKSNNSKTIEIIDIQISTLENNINMLKQLRETLVN